MCEGIYDDLTLWTGIYNKKGIDGLIQELTLSHEEFMLLLQGENINKLAFKEKRWEWLYKNIVDYQLVMIEHSKIYSLGIDFYLFKRNKK